MKLFVLFAASAALVCAQAPTALPINTLPPDTVVAKADGKSITAGQIRTLLESGDPSAVNLAQTDPERFLGSVFVMQFLSSEGDKAHLADESPLKEQLQYLRDRVVANAMVNRIRETYYPATEEINASYAKNSSRYEQAFIKAIVIGFCPPLAQPNGTTDEDLKKAAMEAFSAAHCEAKHTEEEARTIAAKAEARVRAGEDFVKLVNEFSEDEESKAAAGDFPLVTRTSSYSNEIKSTVFSLKNGEVSDPVRSGNYLYIIKIRERSVQPIDAVREPIIQELKQKHFTDWMQEISVRFKPVIERPDFFIKPADKKPAGPAQLVPQP